MPQTSIIIITKNQKDYLSQSLPKVFDQNIKDFEVIIIDSGSEDKTCKFYQDFGPVKIANIEPAKFNYAQAFNTGAKIARGKYLIRLSGDAVPVDNDWLSHLISPLEKNQKIAGVSSRWLNFPQSNWYDKLVVQISMPKIPLFIKPIAWQGASAALRKNLWEKVQFDENMICCEEIDWAFKISRQGYRFFYNPKSQVYHSHNEGPAKFFKRGILYSSGLSQILKRHLTRHYQKFS